MKNSMIGILSICFGLLGFFSAYWYIGIIPCIIAVILGVVGLMDYLAYKWSSIIGLICAGFGIALFIYAVTKDIGDGNLIIACDKGDFVYVSNVGESDALNEYAEMLSIAQVKAAEKKLKEDEEDAEDAEDARGADGEQRRGSSADNTVVVDRTANNAETAASDGYVKGTNYGTYWESEWLGMRYDQPSGFELVSGEELDIFTQFASAMASMVSDAADVPVEEDDVLSMLQNTVYELAASTDSGDVNFILGVEKSDESVSSYMERFRQQQQEAYGSSFVKDMEFEGTEEIGGKYFEKYTYAVNEEGFNINQVCYITKKNDRLVYIVLTYPEGSSNGADAIMSGFSEL